MFSRIQTALFELRPCGVLISLVDRVQNIIIVIINIQEVEGIKTRCRGSRLSTNPCKARLLRRSCLRFRPMAAMLFFLLLARSLWLQVAMCKLFHAEFVICVHGVRIMQLLILVG